MEKVTIHRHFLLLKPTFLHGYKMVVKLTFLFFLSHHDSLKKNPSLTPWQILCVCISGGWGIPAMIHLEKKGLI